jgi:hypothetical protein
MKRRRFIGTTLSVLSLTVMDYELTQAKKIDEKSNKNVLERFVEVFDFERCEKCWSDFSFARLYEQTSVDLLKNKYCLSDKHTFLFATSNLVMVAHELNVASLGSVGRCFLFYERLPGAQWHYLKSFNAYEAEAIIRSATTIEEQLPKKRAVDFLLPCYVKQRKPFSYATRKGHVDMKVRLNDTEAMATIQIWENHQAFFDEEYHLPYALTISV